MHDGGGLGEEIGIRRIFTYNDAFRQRFPWPIPRVPPDELYRPPPQDLGGTDAHLEEVSRIHDRR